MKVADMIPPARSYAAGKFKIPIPRAALMRRNVAPIQPTPEIKTFYVY